MSNKQLSVCAYLKTKRTIMLITKIFFLIGHTHTRHNNLVLKLKCDCPFANRQISQDYNPNSDCITEAAEVNGGVCSFTRKLQHLFINKMRTRPIVNLNVL